MPKVKGLKELTLLVKQQKREADTADMAEIYGRKFLPCLLIFINRVYHYCHDTL